jgi:hypothetical protein
LHRYAKAKGLELTVKAGGHSMSSLCTGLVIDVSHVETCPPPFFCASLMRFTAAIR